MAEVDVRKQSGRSVELSRLRPFDLFNANPFALMRRFSEEMDRMFSGHSGWRGDEVAQWAPAIDVREHDGKLEIVADLPGIKENEVKVEVTDQGLVIQGERKREHEEKREGYYRSERSYGQFYRVIPLPENANLDQARAEFHNGELRVSVPVPERQQRTRQIPINTSPERKEPLSQAAGASQGRKTG